MKKFGIIAVLLINLAGLCLAVNYSLSTSQFLQLAIAGGIGVSILIIEMIFIEKIADSYSPTPIFTGLLTIMVATSCLSFLDGTGEGVEFLSMPHLLGMNICVVSLYLCCGSAIPLTIAGLLAKE